jgi:hypothetical protein
VAKNVRNPTSVSGVFLETSRAQNPRFEKPNCGKFEREKFARGPERGFRGRAAQDVRSDGP